MALAIGWLTTRQLHEVAPSHIFHISRPFGAAKKIWTGRGRFHRLRLFVTDRYVLDKEPCASGQFSRSSSVQKMLAFGTLTRRKGKRSHFDFYDLAAFNVIYLLFWRQEQAASALQSINQWNTNILNGGKQVKITRTLVCFFSLGQNGTCYLNLWIHSVSAGREECAQLTANW